MSNYYFMLVLRVSCLTQSFSQLNKIYKRQRKDHNLVVSINLTSSEFFVSYLARAYFKWYRHVDTISFLLFNKFCSLYAAISNFWVNHSRQRFLCGLYGIFWLFPISLLGDDLNFLSARFHLIILFHFYIYLG